MAFVDTGDLKLGFWVGLGVVLAFAVWALASGLIARARGAVYPLPPGRSLVEPLLHQDRGKVIEVQTVTETCPDNRATDD